MYTNWHNQTADLAHRKVSLFIRHHNRPPKSRDWAHRSTLWVAVAVLRSWDWCVWCWHPPANTLIVPVDGKWEGKEDLRGVTAAAGKEQLNWTSQLSFGWIASVSLLKSTESDRSGFGSTVHSLYLAVPQLSFKSLLLQPARSITEWNLLPDSIPSLASVPSFTSQLSALSCP